MELHVAIFFIVLMIGFMFAVEVEYAREQRDLSVERERRKSLAKLVAAQRDDEARLRRDDDARMERAARSAQIVNHEAIAEVLSGWSP